jgi:hypothetical protein
MSLIASIIMDTEISIIITGIRNIIITAMAGGINSSTNTEKVIITNGTIIGKVIGRIATGVMENLMAAQDVTITGRESHVIRFPSMFMMIMVISTKSLGRCVMTIMVMAMLLKGVVIRPGNFRVAYIITGI